MMDTCKAVGGASGSSGVASSSCGWWWWWCWRSFIHVSAALSSPHSLQRAL